MIRNKTKQTKILPLLILCLSLFHFRPVEPNNKLGSVIFASIILASSTSFMASSYYCVKYVKQFYRQSVEFDHVKIALNKMGASVKEHSVQIGSFIEHNISVEPRKNCSKEEYSAFEKRAKELLRLFKEKNNTLEYCPALCGISLTSGLMLCALLSGYFEARAATIR